MAEKDYIKRLLKELVDYCLYHGMYHIETTVDYEEGHRVQVTVTAPFEEEPYDLPELLAGLAIDKHPQIDTVYNALLGSHSRDKNYTLLGKTLDAFELTTDNHCFCLTIIRQFDNEAESFFM